MNNHEDFVFMNNKKKLMDLIEIHPDDIGIVDSTVEKLAELGVGIITSLTPNKTDRSGWAFQVINDEEKAFHLILSEYGSIELLRKNDSDGEAGRLHGGFCRHPWQGARRSFSGG